MRHIIKITYLNEENEYYVFVDGIDEYYGYGDTEEKAICNFLDTIENDADSAIKFKIKELRKQLCGV